MNTLEGKISEIETLEGISLISIIVNTILFKSIILETPHTADYLKIGNPIRLHFKETEVIIGKGNIDQISLQNQIQGNVSSIEKGKILSKVIVTCEVGTICSIITSNSVERLKLDIGDTVYAMIKTNEIMLSND